MILNDFLDDFCYSFRGQAWLRRGRSLRCNPDWTTSHLLSNSPGDRMTPSDPSRIYSNVSVISHPLVQHKLTLMRRVETHTQDFRRLLKEIAMLLAYEVTRDLPLRYERIQTPLAEMKAPVLAPEKNMVIVSIMRAGQGLLDGMLELMPTSKVGHIGLYREPTTLTAVEYYLKLPYDVEARDMLVVDPMLATGNSAVAAVDRLKEANPLSIKFVCLLAAPEGLHHFHQEHPDVPVYTGAIDDCLDERGYIIPGLGDAGDRLYGTK